MASKGRPFAGTVDTDGEPDEVLTRISLAAGGLDDFGCARVGSALVITRRYFSTWRYVVGVIFFPVGLLAFLSKDADVLNVAIEPFEGGSRIRFNGATTDELARRLKVVLVDEAPARGTLKPGRICAEGHAMREGTFCPQCGAREAAAATCPQGHPVEPGDQFCRTCGQPIS